MNPTQTLPYLPLAKSLLPARSWTRDVLLILGGSLLVALLAQGAIPTQPVPITLQTLGVLLVGAALGSRLGALAMLAYLIEGMVLPVFAGGTTWGSPGKIFTAGYLISYPLAAFLVGWLVERFGTDRSVLKTFLAMLVGSLVIYALGVIWLGVALGNVGKFAGLPNLLSLGMTKFLWGDVVKAAIAAALLPSAWRFIRR